MKVKNYIMLLGCVLIIFSVAFPADAEIATIGEARTVADNWMSLSLNRYGHWGDFPTAAVVDCEELQKDSRLVGFVCHVEPKGFILVSLVKGLAPVKAYSTTSDFSMDSDNRVADFFKQKMVNLIDALEIRANVQVVKKENLESLLEINYIDQWTELLTSPDLFTEQLISGPDFRNYLENDILIQSSWHQFDPYYRQCPTPADVGSSSCFEPHCTVGCTALAAGQIMKYWSWPPSGVGYPFDDPYNWTNIPYSIDGNSPPEQIDATANLVREIGHSADMNYCIENCASGAFHDNMKNAYIDHFRYSDFAVTRIGSDYTLYDWWNEIVQQINSNQPIQYGIPGHSLVCDGWKIESGMRWYHMNYGWQNTSSNTWYALDALPGSDLTQEYIIINIFPAVSLGGAVSGYIGEDPSFNYRYFNADCSGTGATFGPGQWLQFLPGIDLTATPGSYIAFEGTETKPSILFSGGDLSKGLLINSGELRLYDGGRITLY